MLYPATKLLLAAALGVAGLHASTAQAQIAPPPPPGCPAGSQPPVAGLPPGCYRAPDPAGQCPAGFEKLTVTLAGTPLTMCHYDPNKPPRVAAQPAVGPYLHGRAGRRMMRVSVGCPARTGGCAGELRVEAVLHPLARPTKHRQRPILLWRYNMRPGSATQLFIPLPRWARKAALDLPPHSRTGYGCRDPKAWRSWPADHAAWLDAYRRMNPRSRKACASYRLPVHVWSTDDDDRAGQAARAHAWQVLRLYRSDVASVLPKKGAHRGNRRK